MPPGPGAARAGLAGRQADLVAALVAGGRSPARFEAARLEATRDALLDKRRAAVAHAWPALADVPGFAARFAAFAADRPPVGTQADAVAFAAAVLVDLAGERSVNTPGESADGGSGGPSDESRADLLRLAAARSRGALRVSRRPRGRTLVAVRLPLLGWRVLALGRTRGV